MGIWDYLRRFVETPDSQQPAEPLSVQSWHEGNCRYVEWDTKESSWEESERLIERFLTSAVEAAARAGQEPSRWLVLTYEPRQGALTLVPARDPKADEDDWPIHWTLGSTFLESEAQRARSAEAPQEMQDHVARVWRIVSRSLTKGEASHRLAEARADRPLRVAGYDYHEGQERGASRLKETGELA